VPSVAARWGGLLHGLEVVSVAFFSIEYLLRLWSCTADPRYAHPIVGRIRYALTPMALIDLLAVLPFYLVFLDVDLRILRALRMIRVTRIIKLGRYSEASGLLLTVLRAKREELVLTFSLLATLAVMAASLVYAAETAAQPDKFPDIPHALWWAVATVTTVGYGDIVPVTPLGKIIGSATALIGILMIALPTAVFGAGFLDELNARRAGKKTRCPHCGGAL